MSDGAHYGGGYRPKGDLPRPTEPPPRPSDRPHIPDDTDAWALLVPHLDAAIAQARAVFSGDLRGLLQLAQARYYEGERQYRRDWLTRPPIWFDQEAASEAADLIVYYAMRRAREEMGS